MTLDRRQKEKKKNGKERTRERKENAEVFPEAPGCPVEGASKKMRRLGVAQPLDLLGSARWMSQKPVASDEAAAKHVLKTNNGQLSP